jgi:hypothetical protein
MVNFGDERLPPRFWDRVVPEPNSGCWFWLGYTSARGYGKFGQVFSHRATYLALVGEHAPGLELDHLCQEKACCNPDHLEAVTHQVNVSRGRLGATNIARGATVTHCRKGHEYTAENTIIGCNGRRKCKACNYASSAAIMRARRIARGLTRNHPRMTLADAEKIRDRRAAGERARDIADDLGISDMTVHDIVAGRTWLRKAA